MKLIAILLSLWADRRYPDYVDLRQFTIYNMMAKIVLKLGIGGEKPWITYLLLTVLPAWIIMMAISTLGIISPIEILLWAVALYLCLPSEPQDEKVKNYLAASRSGLEDEARQLAESILEETPPDSDSERDRAILRRLFSGATLNIVSLLFWFSVLGIGGALFYRFNWQLCFGASGYFSRHETLGPFVRQSLGLLTWIPARVLVLAYAVVGRFSPAFSRLFGRAAKPLDRLEANFELASNGGFAASGYDETSLCDEDHIESGWALVRRAGIALLILLGLYTFYSWL